MQNLQKFAPPTFLMVTRHTNIDLSLKTKYAKYAKDVKKYARYVSMKFICKICRNVLQSLS